MPHLDSDLLASIEWSAISTVVTDPRQPDNPIVAANKAFCRLTGYEVDEILGRNCRFLAGPKTDPSASRRLGAAIANEASVLVELVNYRKDGTTFHNAVMIAPSYDKTGALQFFIGSQMAVDEASSSSSARRQRAEALVERLTPRQANVLALMASGLRNKQIAVRLEVSEKTVKMHRAHMLTRLATRSSADAIRIAVEAGL